MIHVNEENPIPLFGLDFLGIVDRGTNVLEIKTHTICQLKCKYCFVSAGSYNQNFTIDVPYLVDNIKETIEYKGVDDIEIHIAPYGEIMLYKQWEKLIREMRKIPQVKIISLQSNGLLLTKENVQKLADAGMDRLNLSLNSMDEEQCAGLCGVKKYDLQHLLDMFDAVLETKMELLIAPVWFMKKNDEGILDIIKYVAQKQKDNPEYTWPKLRLGIQNYLTYKTGRKLKKIHSREFKFFYEKLTELEEKYGLKLKLGPNDFNIHTAPPVSPKIKVGTTMNVRLHMRGRYDNEYITMLKNQEGKTWAIKVLIPKPISKKVGDLTGRDVNIKIIKGNLIGNLLTAILDEK